MSKDDRYRGGKRIMPTEDAFHQAVTNSRTKSVTDYRRTKDLVKAYTPKVSKRREGAPRNAAEARRRGEKAAAERLGVSHRTLQSWTHKDPSKRRNPNKANLGKVRTEHNSSQVRKGAMPGRRRNRLTKKGMKVRINANQGPISQKYQRVREIATEFPPAAAERIMDAFVDDGPEGAQRQVTEEMSAEGGYSQGMEWIIEDITKLEFEPGENESGEEFDE